MAKGNPHPSNPFRRGDPRLAAARLTQDLRYGPGWRERHLEKAHARYRELMDRAKEGEQHAALLGESDDDGHPGNR